MKKSKYSRNKKITKRKGTMKYRQYRQYRQYGGDDKKEKIENFEQLKTEIESAQTKLSKDLTDLLNTQSELINNPQNIDREKLNNLKEQYTISLKFVEEKKEALDKLTTEILGHLMDDMRAVQKMHSKNGSTTTETHKDEVAVADNGHPEEYSS